MARVRFYDTCDKCETARSDDYTPMPTCSVCGDRICSACAVPDSLRELDYDGGDGFAVMRQVVTCQSCHQNSPAWDSCMCGHHREDHFDYPNARGHVVYGCGVVVRADGTGCRCRGFVLDDGSERHEDNGSTYADPRDARDA